MEGQGPGAPEQRLTMLWLCPQEEMGPAAQGQGHRSSLSGVCYLTMGLLVLLLGLVFASMYVYRYFFITQVGVTWEALLAPSARAARPPWRKVLWFLLSCTVVTQEPGCWVLQMRHFLSGILRLTSIPDVRKGLPETLSFPYGFVLLSF